MGLEIKAILWIAFLLMVAGVLIKLADAHFDARLKEQIEDDHYKWDNPRDNYYEDD